MSSLSYNGYIGSAEFDADSLVFWGKLLHIRDLVTYEAETAADLKVQFEAAIDEYLADCASLGKDPDKPFKGSFNIRIEPEIHREIALRANQDGSSLNEYVGGLLKAGLQGDLRYKDVRKLESSFNSLAEMMYEVAGETAEIEQPKYDNNFVETTDGTGNVVLFQKRA